MELFPQPDAIALHMPRKSGGRRVIKPAYPVAVVVAKVPHRMARQVIPHHEILGHSRVFLVKGEKVRKRHLGTTGGIKHLAQGHPAQLGAGALGVGQEPPRHILTDAGAELFTPPRPQRSQRQPGAIVSPLVSRHQMQGPLYRRMQGLVEFNHLGAGHQACRCARRALAKQPGPACRLGNRVPHIQRAAAATVEQAGEDHLNLAFLVTVLVARLAADRRQQLVDKAARQHGSQIGAKHRDLDQLDGERVKLFCIRHA